MALKTGQKPRHEALGLTIDDAKGMYRAMLLTRMLGERMMQMNRMGRAAFVGVADGHEAAEVGSAWVIRRGHDWARSAATASRTCCNCVRISRFAWTRPRGCGRSIGG